MSDVCVSLAARVAQELDPRVDRLTSDLGGGRYAPSVVVFLKNFLADSRDVILQLPFGIVSLKFAKIRDPPNVVTCPIFFAVRPV